MKKQFLVLIAAMMFLFSCKKEDGIRELPGDASKTQLSIVDETEVLKPVGGYSSSKRSADFAEAQLKGKPVKNNVGNITNLTTDVISPYQIDLYFFGVRNAVSYNIYRNDILVGNTTQPHYRDYGLTAGTTYKYQVAGVASNGVVGNLSNVAYGTTFSSESGKIIYFLQFNKDTVTDKNWIPYTGGLPFVTEASGFNDEEQQIITDGIAADYAQFPNVRVTRNKAEWLAASPSKRAKTIFTISHEWFSGSPTPIAGGVSYFNTLGLDIPNFVFSSALYYNTYYNICAGTHENGHAVGGLHHAVDYYPGQNYGLNGNHMGAAYSQPVRFFADGQLTSLGSREDQITTLNSRTQ